MSSKNCEQKSRGIPYHVQKISLGNNNGRTRKNPPKLCPDCKETKDCIKLISNKLSRIEELVLRLFQKRMPINFLCLMQNLP
jgi:hypothetical protein